MSEMTISDGGSAFKSVWSTKEVSDLILDQVDIRSRVSFGDTSKWTRAAYRNHKPRLIYGEDLVHRRSLQTDLSSVHHIIDLTKYIDEERLKAAVSSMPRLKHIQMAAGRRDVLRDPVYSEFRFSLPDARGSFQRPAGGTGRLSDAGSFRYAPKDVFCSPGGRFFASVYKVTNETQLATDIPDALALKQRDELDGLDFRLFHIAFGNGAKRSMVSVYDEAASIIAQSGAKIEHVSFSSCCGTRILGRDNRYSTLSLVMGANLWSTLTSQIVSVDIGEWDTEKIMSPTNINESIKVVRLIPCRDKHPSANQLAEALTRSCDRTDVKFELSESGGEPRGQFKSFTDELTKAMGICWIGPKQPSDTTDVSTGQSSRTKFYGWECWE